MSSQLGPVQFGHQGGIVESASERTATVAASDATLISDGSVGNATESVAQFIWPDSDHDAPQSNITGPTASLGAPSDLQTQASLDDASSHAARTAEDVVTRMSELIEDELALPRIITASATDGPVGEPIHDEQWRRQFLSALHSVDREISQPTALLAAKMATTSPARSKDAADTAAATEPSRHVTRFSTIADFAFGQNHLAQAYAATSRVLIQQRHIVLGLGTVVAITGVVSTAIPQIANLSQRQSHIVVVSADAADVRKPATAHAKAPQQSKLNAPVLVREGIIGSRSREHFTFAPSLAAPRLVKSIAVDEPARSLIPLSAEPSTMATAPAAEVATTATHSTPPSSEAAAPTPPALDRPGLMDLVNQPPTPGPAAPKSPTTHVPLRTQPVPHASAPRASSKAHPPERKARLTPVERPRQPTKQVTPAQSQWSSRRQGLRTAAPPEPEPSTLKKLFGAIWPGSSSTTEAAQPEPKKSTPPVPVAPLYSWSDTSHPTP